MVGGITYFTYDLLVRPQIENIPHTEAVKTGLGIGMFFVPDPTVATIGLTLIFDELKRQLERELSGVGSTWTEEME